MAYILLGLFIYFTPSLIAVAMEHRYTLAIFILNLFMGWTFVGWVAALVWVCMREEEHDRRKGA